MTPLLADVDVWGQVLNAVGTVAGVAAILALTYLTAALKGVIERRLKRVEEKQRMYRQGEQDRAYIAANRSDATENGPGEELAPSRITQKARKAFIPIAADLKAMALREELTDSFDLFDAIQKRHEPFLLKHVCPALGFDRLECVALAVRIAREGSGRGRPGQTGEGMVG